MDVKRSGPGSAAAIGRVIAAGLLLAAVAGAGCTTSTSAGSTCRPSTQHPPNALVVEGDPWSGYAPFRPAGGLLPGSLTYREELDQTARACDVTSGRADFEVTTIGQYLKNKPDGSIVGVIDQSQGADALVLNTHDYPYLKSVDWLPKLVAQFAQEGKKPVLAYTGSSPSEELMDELANSYEDFKPDRFELVSVDQSSSALAMLQNHQAQLAIVWEPDTTAARKDGNVVARSSKDVPNSIVDVIVAGNDLIRRDPVSVQRMVDAYYRFIDDQLAHRDTFTPFIAKDAKLNPDDATAVLAGMKLYGSKDADAFMNSNLFPLDEPQVRQTLKAIGSLAALSDPSLVLDDQMANGVFVAKTPKR